MISLYLPSLLNLKQATKRQGTVPLPPLQIVANCCKFAALSTRPFATRPGARHLRALSCSLSLVLRARGESKRRTCAGLWLGLVRSGLVRLESGGGRHEGGRRRRSECEVEVLASAAATDWCSSPARTSASVQINCEKGRAG